MAVIQDSLVLVICLLLGVGKVVCTPDPKVTLFSETDGNTFIQDVSTTVSFNIEVTNNAPSGIGNNIAAVTGGNRNYAFTVQFSDVDMNTGSDTLSVAPVTPTFTTSHLQQGLATSSNFPITCTATMTLAAAKCSAAKYICVTLSEGAGASYTDSDKTPASNIQCVDISSRISCAADPKVTSLTETLGNTFAQDINTAVSFTIQVTNNAATGGSNDIAAVTGGNVNYVFSVQFSDVDMNTGTDTLGESAVTPTFSLSDRQQAVTASNSFIITGTGTMNLPSAKCVAATYICATLTVGSGASYSDADTSKSSNIKCIDISSRKSCVPDPKVTAFSETLGHVFKQDVSTSVSFTIQVTNNATTGGANNIVAVTGGNRNYAFTVKFSDVDMSTGTDTLSLAAVGPVFTGTDLQQALTASSNFDISGTTSMTLPSANCIAAGYICVTLTEGVGASYTDSDTSKASNIGCTNISARKSCVPDPKITSFTENTGTTFHKDTSTAVSFMIQVTNNAASASGNDIIAVTGSNRNYAFAVQFSDFEMSTGTNTLSLSTVTPTSTASELQQNLTATSNFNIVGTTSLNLAAAICLAAKYICVTLSVGTGASYTDADTSKASNIRCIDITSRKSCSPDPQATTVTESSGSFIKQDTNLALSFTIKVTNGAPAGNGNDIAVVTGTQKNYAFVVQFSDVDMSIGTNTLSIATVTPSIAASDLQQALAATNNFHVSGTATLNLPANKCIAARYICATLSAGTGASYIDSDTSKGSNIRCVDITARKTCVPDPEVTAFSETAGNTFIQNINTGATFSVQITNNAATASGNDIIVVTGGDRNYALTVQFSDVDMNTGTDTLSIAPVTPSFSATDLQQALGATNNFVTSGSTPSMNIPSAKCGAVQYICVSLTEGAGASYTDADSGKNSNIRCLDISARKSCAPDPQTTTVSETFNNIIKQNTNTAMSFTIKVTNGASAGSGNNIAAVTGSDANFAFVVQFSDVDMNTGTDGLSLTPVTPSFTPSELKQGLIASNHFDITGTATLNLPTAKCIGADYLCVSLTEGSGASYTDGDPAKGSNIRCVSIAARKSCVPDPKVNTFTETLANVFKQNTNVAVSFTVQIRNNAAAASGNNIIAVSGGNANYAMVVQFSDADMSSGTDSLSLSTLTPGFPAADLQQGVAAASNFGVTGTATMNLASAKCIAVTHICVTLTEGTGASYVDADPAKTSNIKCIDITARKSCVPDPKITSVTETLNNVFKQNANTLTSFTIRITNNAAAASGNNIIAVTGGNRNYALSVKFSDVDMNTGTDTLSITAVSPTFTTAHLQQGLAASNNFNITGAATLNLAAAHCAAVRYACVILTEGTGASYTDADPVKTSNIRCVDISSRKMCAPDPEVNALSDSSGNIFVRDEATSVSYSIIMKNAATGAANSGNDIAAAAGSDENYKLQFQFSDKDLETGASDALSFTPVDITLAPTTDKQRALTAGNTFTTSGTHSLTLTTAHCQNGHYLCAIFTVPTTATYTDFDTTASSNIKCISIDSRKTCDPDPEVTSFSETSGGTFKANVASTAALSFTIQNTATAAAGYGNNILAITGSDYNYEFELQLSDKDMETATDTLNLARIAVTTTVDRQQALAASNSFSGTGSASVTIPTAQCTSVKYLCFILKIPTAAKYKDKTDTLASNAKCEDITSRMLCAPDPQVTTFSETLGKTFEGNVNTAVGFIVKITNGATTGSGNDIAAVTGSNRNYAFTVQFSDVDMNTGTDTLAVTPVTVAFAPSKLKQGLAASSNFDISGSGSVNLPSAKCTAAMYLCITLSEGTGASYTDADASKGSNIRCTDISTRKSCAPDATVDAFTDSATNVFIRDDAVSVSYSITLKNAATAGATTGNNIKAATGTDQNYKLQFKFSDKDLGTGAADALGFAAVDISLSPANSQKGLNAGASFSVTGSHSLTIGSSDCQKAHYLCAVFTVPSSATYTDTDTAATSNIKCIAIDSRKTCDPDPEVTVFTEGSGVAFKQGTSSSVSLSFTIGNTATSAAGNGNNILLATGGDQNFGFELALSDKDMEAATDTLGLSPITITTTANKQQALNAGGTFSGTGTASVTIPAGQCTTIRYLCFILTVPSTAKYKDKTNTHASNAKCVDISARMSCAPDPKVTDLSETLGNIFKQTVNTATSFTIEVTNVAAVANGNNIAVVTGSDKNYAFAVQFSDVDMNVGSDTLAITPVSPTFTPAHLQQAVAASSNFAITGTTDLNLAAAKCAAAKYVCVTLTEGTGAGYTDIDKTKSSNIRCIDITARKSCVPDPSVDALSETGGEILVVDAAVTLAYSITLANAATAGSNLGNDIIVATGSDDNYKLQFQFSDKDLETGASDTLSFTSVDITLSPALNTKRALAAGSSFTTTGTHSITLPSAKCQNAHYLCTVLTIPATATYADADTGASSNMECISIDARKTCDPVTAFSETSGVSFKQGIASTVALSFTIGNTATAATGNGNGILVGTGSVYNFEFDMALSDKDMEAASDNLNLPRISVTTAVNRQQALAAGASFSGTGSASVIIPSAQCGSIQYLCFILNIPATAKYKDKTNTLASNAKCVDISNKLACAPNAEMFQFTDTSSGLVYHRGLNTGLTFSAVIKNAATGAGNNIIAVTAPKSNYRLVFQFSDKDMEVASDTLGLPAQAATTTADLKQGLAAGAQFSLTGTGSVSLPGSSCAAVQYLCLKLEIPVTASHTDVDVSDSSNVKCASLSGKKSCFPDPKITLFEETSSEIYKSGVAASTTFRFTNLNNAAAASGNDIIVATGANKNFKYELIWSDNVDVASNTLTLPAIATTVATADLQKALSATQSYTATGTASSTIPAVKCTAIKYMCIVLSEDATANYEDANTSEASNTKCDDISQRIVCAPDPAVQIFTGANSFTYTENVATSITVTADVRNIAGSGNNVVEVTGSDANFKFELVLTDVDLSTGAADSLTITPTALTLTPATMAQNRLHSNSVLSFTGTASITIASAKCPQVVYMCLRLSEGTGASYTDPFPTNNVKCTNIDNVKFCIADIEVTVFSEPANAVIYQSTATTLSFSTTVKNNGGDSISATSGSNYNFQVKVQLSDKDIAAPQTDTLGLGELATTITVNSERQAALANGNTHTMSGTTSVTIASTKCNAIRYLCVHVVKGNNAKYIDTDNEKNWKCKDIENQKRCFTDPSVKTFSDTTSPSPVFFYGTDVTLSISIDLKNAATSASGNNILAVTGSDRNFKFKVWFANVDMGTGAKNTLGVSEFTPTLPASKLREGLTAGGAAKTITGTVKVNLPQAKCVDARYLCAEVDKGTGAEYKDSSSINNAKCIDVSTRKSCLPDPSVRDFREPGNTALVKATATTVNIQIDLENVGAPGSGNNIFAVSNPNANFKFELYLSDVNMQFGNDNLNLGAINPTITSDLKQGLQVGASNVKTFVGTASVTIPAAQCTQISQLCLKLSAGSGASYKDAYTVNNIKCKDISAQKGCDADPAAMTFDTVPSSVTFMQNKVQAFNFAVKVENVAVGASSNLAAVTGGNQNFEVVVKLTNADLGAGGSDSLSLSDITTTIPTANLQQKLDIGSANAITLTGSASIQLTSSTCTQVLYLCVHVKTGTGASYTDSNPANNFKCKSMNSLITCSPDLEISTLEEKTSPSSVFLEGSASTFKFKLKIINTASNVANNKIISVALPKINYKVTIKLTNGDLGTASGTDTLGLADLTFNIPDKNELLNELAVGPFNTINGDTSVTLSQSDCVGAKYLCFNVIEDTANQASFIDANKNYKNWKCQDIEAKKKCKPSFTNLPATVQVSEDQVTKTLIHTTVVTDGNGDALTFSMTSNVASAPFSVESDGRVFVNANPNLDYESGTRQYQLTVSVTDGDFTETAILTVNIVEEPEPPVFTNLPATLTLAETATLSVFTATATDQDVGDVLTLTATVSPSTNPFIFNASTGLISLPATQSLDFEMTPYYSITLEATDKTARKAVSYLNITITDVPEPPVLDNLPATISVTENELIGRLIFTITATDPEGQTPTFNMVPVPNEGNFLLSPPGGGNVLFKSSPGFDYEKTKTYTLSVTATDGVLVSAPALLTVNVQDVNEKPVLTNLPAVATVAENAAANTAIFDTGASDPEGNALTYNLNVSPNSGSGAFKISTTGQVEITQSPKLDYETQALYNLTVQACDAALCSDSKFLSVEVTNANEAPVFNPTTGTTSLNENTPTGSVLNVTLSYVDPDKADTATFSLVPSTYSSFFSINPSTGSLSLAQTVNAETMPTSVTFDIMLQDAASNKALYGLTVNIVNQNDNLPTFAQSTYNAGTMDENKAAGTAVVTVSASDADTGTFGDITYSIVDSPANTYFQVTKQADKSGLVSIKSPVDRETYPSMTFNVYATDGGGRQTSASVQVTFADVNDNKPIFDYPFYNWEVPSNAAIGTSVGVVHATDGDVTGNSITYAISPGTDSNDFLVSLTTGQVNTKASLVTGKLYTLSAVASDSGTPVDNSVPAVIRIDAFDSAQYLMDWEVSGAPSSFSAAKKQQFIDAITALCTPCVPRIAEVAASDVSVSQSILRVYFLVDNNTGSGDVTLTKNFITNQEITSRMTKDSVGTPADVVNLATFNDFPVYKIGPASASETPSTASNWWLDKAGGQATTAVLSILCAGLLIAGITVAAIYGCGLLPRKAVLPKKTPVSAKNVQLMNVRNNVWDAKYAKSPQTKLSNTKVTELKAETWRDKHRPPSNPSNRADKGNRPPSPVERNASRLSQISSRQIDLNVDDGRWSPNKLNRPSPLMSDQRYW